jgi:hypothetical protein
MDYAYSGGCQCGAIRYKIEGQLIKATICHCRMCQKAFGSWGAPLASVPLAKLHWTRGQPSEFHSSSISSRGFCQKCGTPMSFMTAGEDSIEIAMGTFDKAELVGPLVEQIGVESRLPWFFGMERLPERVTSAGRTPEEMEKLKSLQHPDCDTPNDWSPEKSTS